ncbi:MAG: hypothetical protein AAFV72_25985 [Cyanobacteria bacterium J06635_1]
MELVEETLQEITLNSDPDLSEADRELIETYQGASQSEPQSKIHKKPAAAEPDHDTPVLGVMPFVA